MLTDCITSARHISLRPNHFGFPLSTFCWTAKYGIVVNHWLKGKPDRGAAHVALHRTFLQSQPQAQRNSIRNRCHSNRPLLHQAQMIMSSSSDHQRVTNCCVPAHRRVLWLRVLPVLWPVRFQFSYDFLVAKRFYVMASRPCLHSKPTKPPKIQIGAKTDNLTAKFKLNHFAAKNIGTANRP